MKKCFKIFSIFIIIISLVSALIPQAFADPPGTIPYIHTFLSEGSYSCTDKIKQSVYKNDEASVVVTAGYDKNGNLCGIVAIKASNISIGYKVEQIGYYPTGQHVSYRTYRINVITRSLSGFHSLDNIFVDIPLTYGYK